MAKIDEIKEKINILRDDYRNLFIFFITVITGSFTIFFQVITDKIGLLYGIIGLFGIVISLFTLIKLKQIRYDIDNLISKLGELNEWDNWHYRVDKFIDGYVIWSLYYK